MHVWARRLPWIDGVAALVAGTVVLLLRGLLAGVYGLSLDLMTFIGAVNIAYAAPGLCLGALRPRPVWLLRLLIGANLAWAVACVAVAIHVWSSARVFGLAQLLGEGLFVASLAALEARHRRDILDVDR